MLISEKRKFIFIHVHKTAGTSIRYALTPFVAPRWQVFINKALKKLNIKPPKAVNYSPFFQHCKAYEIINEFGKDKFESYFSFGFVRNPWDWQVSLYKYILKKETHYEHHLIKEMEDFDEYIRWRCSNEVGFQKNYLFDANEQLVDYVGRFENLEEDFQKICNKIGINASLKKKNVSNSVPYQEFYNEETKQLVYHTFEKDIRLFNYRF